MISKPNVYAAQWQRWWKAINPDWCYPIKGNQLARKESGDWECLQVGGPNGTVSIVASLWFWRERTPDTSPALQSWQNAVKDVSYALQEALLFKERQSAADENEEDEEEEDGEGEDNEEEGEDGGEDGVDGGEGGDEGDVQEDEEPPRKRYVSFTKYIMCSDWFIVLARASCPLPLH